MWLPPVFGDKVSAQHADRVKLLRCRPRGVRARGEAAREPVVLLALHFCKPVPVIPGWDLRRGHQTGFFKQQGCCLGNHNRGRAKPWQNGLTTHGGMFPL